MGKPGGPLSQLLRPRVFWIREQAKSAHGCDDSLNPRICRPGHSHEFDDCMDGCGFRRLWVAPILFEEPDKNSPVVTCAVMCKFIEWVGAFALPPHRTRLTTLPFTRRTSQSKSLIGLISSGDGIEKGVIKTLLGVCGMGDHIADILEDLREIH